MGRLDEVSATQAFAVKAAGARGTSLAPYLRLAVRKSYLTAGNLVITPDLSLGITDNIGNPGARLRLSTQDGTIFNSSAAHLAPVSGQFGAGLSVGRGGWSLNLRYSGAAAGSFLAQNVQAGVQVSF
jgi:hypothetical protein